MTGHFHAQPATCTALQLLPLSHSAEDRPDRRDTGALLSLVAVIPSRVLTGKHVDLRQPCLHLFLVNGQADPPKLKDAAWIFQPELSVESPDGAPIFEEKPPPLNTRDTEEQLLELLYRRQIEFAVGHGVAVQASLAPDSRGLATRLPRARG